MQFDFIKLHAKVFHDRLTTGEDGDIFEHGLATIAITGGLHRAHIQNAAQLVHHQRGEGFTFNILGDIPGGAKRDEIVMIGAHFDSWHGGTGATDNAAGSAVMIEVMRILSVLKPKLDRTVRIALWGSEEEGLLGSKAYVKEHFGDPSKGLVTSQHAKQSVYFNLDNGSGKIRGVYLQGHDAARPILENWMAPFRDLGVTTLSIRDTGGTDHLSYDAVGLPGFQFIQDPLDYSTVTHHSSMDTYDHMMPADVMQASAVIAAMVYQAANAQEMFPRKPLPEKEAAVSSKQQ